MRKFFLLRYDTECESQEEMDGFLEKIVEVHRSDKIPATFFCTGGAIEAREKNFRWFHNETEGDPLFDIQDHSYSHIGLGYSNGQSVEALRGDYERSFEIHERVFGQRPIGISICGTGGKEGPRLEGFDQTEKSRAEFTMIAKLGVKMINAFLAGVDESTAFINYASLGHPDIMGFPSAYSDTAWLCRKENGDPLEFVFSIIRAHAENKSPLPIMLHDWVAWNYAFDKELTHVRRIAGYAREHGYELMTHFSCYQNSFIWK